jgi:two-component system chemotaxis response regulator CheB
VNAHTALKARRPERSGPPDAPPIRLLIVDDSSVARAVLSRMVTSRPGFEVLGTAACAAEAIDLLRRIVVDIVLLDIEMPGASGLEALPQIIEAGRGARVLIVSSMAEDGAESAVKALALGAADTMPKPVSGLFGGRFSDALSDRLTRIGRVADGARDNQAAGPAAIQLREVKGWRPECIAIGASTGGIHAVNEFLCALPDRIGVPIFVTQHLPPLFMPYFARQLESASGRTARVVEHNDLVRPDHIHVAPGTGHLRVVRSGANIRTKLDSAPAPSGCLPSVDPMLTSIREAYGRGGVAVMLSGMGRDGLVGSRDLVSGGGVVLAQDQYSSAIWGMPRAVAEAGLATVILPPRELARHVAAQLGESACK